MGRAAAVAIALAMLAGLAGCADLIPPGDGTSLSAGKANGGALINGARLPDSGEGFTTRDIWRERGNRYGTDELLDLIVGVARRLAPSGPELPLVVADISAAHGGAEGAAEFHHSHQTGRDADLLYFMRDAHGPVASDAMRPFDDTGKAKDDSGRRIDIARTWLLVKELVTAPEANVQYIFMYEPIAKLLLDRAHAIGERPEVIARARAALLQPSAARHDDHLHVRVFCSLEDAIYGCAEFGKMDLHEAVRPRWPVPAGIAKLLRRTRGMDVVLAAPRPHH